jgi:hypothetical protein
MGCLNTQLYAKTFYSKLHGALVQYGVFLASFSRSSGIRQKLQNAKTFAFS